MGCSFKCKWHVQCKKLVTKKPTTNRQLLDVRHMAMPSQGIKMFCCHRGYSYRIQVGGLCFAERDTTHFVLGVGGERERERERDVALNSYIGVEHG